MSKSKKNKCSVQVMNRRYLILAVPKVEYGCRGSLRDAREIQVSAFGSKIAS